MYVDEYLIERKIVLNLLDDRHRHLISQEKITLHNKHE